MPRLSRAAVLRAAPLTAIVVVASILMAIVNLRVRNWSVMTDELLYVRLAESIWGGHGLAPHVRDLAYPAYSGLYPLLLAPLYGLLATTDAFRAAHVLNPVLMALAAIPTYHLAMGVRRDRTAALIAAGLSVSVLWTSLSLTMLTESVAYPVFVLLMLAAHRVMTSPGLRREVLALLVLALAIYARTQFALFAVVLPVAALVHDLLHAAGVAPHGARGRALLRELRGTPRRRPLFTAVVVLAAAVIVSGRLGSVTGIYGAVASGDMLPHGIVQAMAAHIAYVAVGAGVLPFVLGLAWAIQTVAKPTEKSEHAFAVLAALAVVTLGIVAASFDLRILGDIIADRYVFYIAPLLCVAFVVALSTGRFPPLALLAACGVFVALVLSDEFIASGVSFFLTPASPYHQVISDQAEWIASVPGLGWVKGNMLIAAGAVIGTAVAVIVTTRKTPRYALAVIGGLVALACFVQTVYTYRTALGGTAGGPAQIPTRGGFEGRNWVDEALDGHDRDAVVALLPKPQPAFTLPTRWWDAEFWNKRIRRMYVASTAPPSSGFATQRLVVDPVSGRISIGDARRAAYLVQDPTDRRLRVRGRPVARARGLVLLPLGSRPSADWTMTGTAVTDGPIGARSLMRVFGTAGERRILHLRLTAPRAIDPRLPAGPQRRRSWSVESSAARRSGPIRPGERVATSVAVCVGTDGGAPVTFRSTGSGRSPRRRSTIGSVVQRDLIGVTIADAWTTSAGRCARSTAG